MSATMLNAENIIINKLKDSFFSLKESNLSKEEYESIDSFFMANLLRHVREELEFYSDEETKNLIDVNLAELFKSKNFSPSSIVIDQSSAYEYLFRSELLETFKTLINEGLWCFVKPNINIDNALASFVGTLKKEKIEFFLNSDLVAPFFKETLLCYVNILEPEQFTDLEFYKTFKVDDVDLKKIILYFLPEKRQILEEFLFSFNHEKFSKKEKVELIKEMFEKDEFNIKVFLVTKDRTEENKTENIEALKRYIMFNDLKDELITNSVKTKKNKV